MSFWKRTRGKLKVRTKRKGLRKSVNMTDMNPVAVTLEKYLAIPVAVVAEAALMMIQVHYTKI